MSNKRYAMELEINEEVGTIVIHRFLHLVRCEGEYTRSEKLSQLTPETRNYHPIQKEIMIGKHTKLSINILDFPDFITVKESLGLCEEIVFYTWGSEPAKDYYPLRVKKWNWNLSIPNSPYLIRNVLRGLSVIFDDPIFTPFKFEVTDQKAERNIIYV